MFPYFISSTQKQYSSSPEGSYAKEAALQSLNTLRNNLTIQGTMGVLTRTGMYASKNTIVKGFAVALEILAYPIALTEQVARAALSPIAALYLIFDRSKKAQSFLYQNFFSQASITFGFPIAGAIASAIGAIFIGVMVASCCFCCCCCAPCKSGEGSSRAQGTSDPVLAALHGGTRV